MEPGSFKDQEQRCESHFASLPTVIHACTPENHEAIFIDEEDFIVAIGILAICVKMYPGVMVYSFQIMSNHIHLLLSGETSEIIELFSMFKTRLRKHLQLSERFVDLRGFELKLYNVDTLDYFRSVLAYINRNGFVVNDEVTPFTYKWGANCCYFNPQMKRYYEQCSRPLKVVEQRSLFHSKVADSVRGLEMLDGMVSPYSFCDIVAGELAFRNAKQYFYYVSRNVESYSNIASIISESVCYTDADIYSVCSEIARKQYDVKSPIALNSMAKVELAKKLHYEYHASDKQIMRILKLSKSVLETLF